MKNPVIPIVVIVICLSASIYQYKQNQTIERKISAHAEECQEKLATIESEYAGRIAALGKKQRTSYRLTSDTTITGDKIEFTELVSYEHQVEAVSHKYEFLLKTVQIRKPKKNNLLKLLIKKERLSSKLALMERNDNNDLKKTGSDIESTLNEVELKIDRILSDPVDYARYEFLEQRSL